MISCVTRARWLRVGDPEAYARRVLAAEAPEIPATLLEGGSWTEDTVSPSELAVDEPMIIEHDADPIHQDRRDRFRRAILAGAPLPPLIAIGPDRHLVDGYARLRAIRLLGVDEVAVVLHVRPTYDP